MIKLWEKVTRCLQRVFGTENPYRYFNKIWAKESFPFWEKKEVEKVWRGKWKWYSKASANSSHEKEYGWRCSQCGGRITDTYDNRDNPLEADQGWEFCSFCGAAMTDFAMFKVKSRLAEMVDLKILKALYEESET